MAILAQQFRVVNCSQAVDGSSTSVTLVPQPGGTSTGTLTAAAGSTVNLQFTGAQTVSVGTIYTLTVS